MLAARIALSPEQWCAKSVSVSRHLDCYLSHHGLLQRGKVVAFCWPIQNEPDMRVLIDQWDQRLGVIPALPVVIAPGQALRFRTWHSGETLVADRYGIPTPAQGEWVLPDLMLLPGNAFDDAGYRLGYGGGFFDRTLASMQPRPLVIGVCFQAARIHDLQPQMHDQAVDLLVTEEGVLRCGPNHAHDLINENL